MTNAEKISQPVPEQIRLEQELMVLHLKSSQYAARFLMLTQLLRDDPGAAVFDEQSRRRRPDCTVHFVSKEFSGEAIKELVSQIREHEDRLSHLKAEFQLASVPAGE
jgi:hypothetical protein